MMNISKFMTDHPDVRAFGPLVTITALAIIVASATAIKSEHNGNLPLVNSFSDKEIQSNMQQGGLNLVNGIIRR